MEFVLNNKVVLRGISDTRIIDEIKDFLTITNPQYKLLQNLDKWTGATPETLKLYDEDLSDNPHMIICPRGFADQAYRICRDHKEKIIFIDQRRELKDVEMQFHGSLRDFQEAAVSGPLFKKQHGVLSAGTGSGKTVMALYIIARRRQPALVVVHTVELLYQWLERIDTFLGIPPEDVGIVGDGRFRTGRKITVGLYQTIRKRLGDLNPLIGQLVVDECHKCPSKTFTEAVSGFEAKYRLGLTATEYRRDGLEKLIFITIGELRHIIGKAPLIETGDLCRARVICRKTDFDTTLDPSNAYPQVIKELTMDEPRNRLICRDIASDSHPGIKLILTDRRDHALTMERILFENHGLTSTVLTGTTPRNQREAIVKALTIGEISILIATGQLIGEGFDLPELAILFLVTPIKFRGRLIQYIGRILRPAQGKAEGIIYDYMDMNVGVLQASAVSRIEIYRREGIVVDEKCSGNDQMIMDNEFLGKSDT
ncbi:MAG: DEAD/DEAH box helicase [Desulfamplus sp.]|nr:DEAD/DEAH box helicase [Desulfamplus sp.]